MDLATGPRPRSLLRRYGADLAVIAGTLLFLAVAGLLGVWMMHR